MRKDEVIRLQLLVPIIRSEVGRIEFTKDYVLFLDRIHKQYVKAKYNDVAFLKNNGINFYSLQALFWNQLFIPGQQRVGEHNLTLFKVDFNASQNASQKGTSIILNDGKMKICPIVKLQACLERLLRRLIMRSNVGQLYNKCEKGCTKKSILLTMHKRFTKLIENDR